MGNVIKEQCTRVTSIWKKIPPRIQVFGFGGCGKTTLLYSLWNNKCPIFTSGTIGINAEKIKYRDKTFDVWEVGGGDKIY